PRNRSPNPADRQRPQTTGQIARSTRILPRAPAIQCKNLQRGHQLSNVWLHERGTNEPRSSAFGFCDRNKELPRQAHSARSRIAFSTVQISSALALLSIRRLNATSISPSVDALNVKIRRPMAAPALWTSFAQTSIAPGLAGLVMIAMVVVRGHG